jgi:methionyl-tRNA formyltransferase
VNSGQTIELLTALRPDVEGTRIISANVLRRVRVPFVHTHAGVTPMYRGVHGADWALVEKRTDLCG